MIEYNKILFFEDEDESEDYKDNSSVPEVKDKDLRRCTKRKHEDEEREDV